MWIMWSPESMATREKQEGGSEKRWHCPTLKRDITVISYLLTLQLEFWWHLVLVEQVRIKRDEKSTSFLSRIS